jgi:putative phosphoribosyl transferase
MDRDPSAKVVDRPDLRDRTHVFANRSEAGAIVAEMLIRGDVQGSVVLAIPAGGVPVAAAIAERLGLPLDLAVVSKITPRWNTEVGYGAVAWDGTVLVDDSARGQMDLDKAEVLGGTAVAQEKVRRRVALLRGNRPMPDLAGATVILVDDGVATGGTILCAAQALRRLSVERIVLAVPTAHGESLRRLLSQVDCVYCPNVRHGWSFAVAEAYRRWVDVTDEQAAAVLKAFRGKTKG